MMDASFIRDKAHLEENMFSLHFLSCSPYPRIVAGRSSKKGPAGASSDSIASESKSLSCESASSSTGCL